MAAFRQTHSVPNTQAQMRTLTPPPITRVSLACVWCGHKILQGSWCGVCWERDVAWLRQNHPGLSRQRLTAMLVESADCECGRPMPRGARGCSRCASLEREIFRNQI